MKYIDEEESQKLFCIGIKVELLKRLTKELKEYFIKDGKPVYGDAEGTEELLDVIKLYIKGEESSYIGEQVFQSDGEPVKKLLGLMGINAK